MSLPPGTQSNNLAMFIPGGVTTGTSNPFTFAYPSPSSASPASSADLLDCSINSNYVNPADLFSGASSSGPQSLSTPASTTSTSSIIPLTPEFQTYMPSFNGSSKDYSSSVARAGSLESSSFDFNASSINSLQESVSNYAGIANDPFTIMESMFSPPQPYLSQDLTSPADIPHNDPALNSSQSNTPFQFAWQPTSQSHGNNEYNTALPFEPSHSSVSPIDIIMKQDSKLCSSNAFSAGAIQNAQLFANFPDVNDVFDLLLPDDKNAPDSKKDVIDQNVRANLIAAVQSARNPLVEMPSAADLSDYVNAYWLNIHPHMPIFFKPGFLASVVSEGILLAICALGSLTMNITHDAVRIISYAQAVVQQRRESGYCALSDVQAMLLLELFELYHRKDVNDDPSRGLSDLVAAARNAGLCDELSNDYEDLSFDPDAEWRAWGSNEERRRYFHQTSYLILEQCLPFISSRRCYILLQLLILLSLQKPSCRHQKSTLRSLATKTSILLLLQPHGRL